MDRIDTYFTRKPSKTKEKKTSKTKMAKSSDFPDLEAFKDQLFSWKSLLKNLINTNTFTNIHQEVKRKYATEKCYPPPKMIFNAFRVTHLKDLKVVIVGQDPYIREGQAMGLCFSVPKGVRVPPSLVNIYKCLVGDPNIKGNCLSQ